MREGLKDLEFQMQVQGLELLIPRPGSETATGRAIDQAAMHAPLAMMAWALKDALEQAFGFLGEYDRRSTKTRAARLPSTPTSACRCVMQRTCKR